MADTISPNVKEGWTGPNRRDDPVIPLKPIDDALHIELGKKNQFEWWYFDAHLESGHTIVAFFHASNPNPGPASGKTGVELTLLRPDGKKTHRFIKYDRSEFEASREIPDVRIGGNYMKVDYTQGNLPVYEIFLDEEEIGFHLTYKCEVNGWMGGDGHAHFAGKGYFAWMIPIPRATVTGTIRDGENEIAVTGIGYHDHNWLDFPFQSFIEYWMWGRVYSENFTVSYAYIQCNEKVDNHVVKGLMLAKGEDVIISTGNFEFVKQDFQFDERAGHYYPRTLMIRIPAELDLKMDVFRVFEAENMLDNFNAVLRFIAGKILRMKPGYFRLDSAFELIVKYNGAEAKEIGNTLHEIVAFKDVQ